MDPKELFKRVIHVQEKHITFLDSTQRNLAYYLFGKNVDLYKRLTIPRINVTNIMNAFSPNSDNPVQSIAGAFIDELSVSEFRTTVKPYPVEGKEPYDSYADILEQQIRLIHKNSNRRTLLRSAAFELLAHGYFGIYFDGVRYYFLTAYDLIPGDPNVVETEAQPFLIRKTQVNKATLEAAGVDTRDEQGVYLYEWAQNDDLEMFTLYDVYVKHSDQNIGFTQKGTVVYNQKMSWPKRYPIFIANTSEILSSFYTVPLMTQLTQKLIDYQKANASIKESSSSIAKPILTYDSDAGIDVDALHRALKMGYKHIIVGKNKEGEIAFKAPGSLPQYAQQLPDKIEDDILKSLGLNKTFMGLPNVGARERGALARLLKTSFRKLSTFSTIIEDAFEQTDKYILDYMNNHCISYGKSSGINIEEIFTGGVKYVPEERFIAYSSEDSLEKKTFVLNKWKSKLISTKSALEEMGEEAPSKMIDEMREEMRDNQNFNAELTKDAQSMQSKSILDLATDRLRGQLEYKFWISPIADKKVMVKVHVSDMETAAFILSDMTNKVLLKSYTEDIPAPINQIDPTVPLDEPVIPMEGTDPNAAPDESQKNKEEINTIPTESKVEQPQPKAENVKPEAKEKPESDNEEDESSDFNITDIEETMSKGQTIYDTNKYKDLSGMYIVEPHAKWIASGRKLALVTAADYAYNLGKPFLFAGRDVYGVILLKKMYDANHFDFVETRKYHMVTDKERKKWWGDKPLYLYIFEFYPFKFPIRYTRTPGQTTFFGKVDLNEGPEPSDDTTGQDKEESVAREKINNTFVEDDESKNPTSSSE